MRSSLPPSRLLLAACLGLSVAVGFAAEDDEIVVGPVPANLPQQRQNLHGINFDQQVFQNQGDAKLGEQRLRTQVALQLSELTRVCQLSDEQKQKLELAARGDVQRFLDEVNVQRQWFNAVKHDQNAVNQMWQKIQPLQNKMARGLTGPGSLSVKVIPKTLTPEQTVRHDAVMGERRRFRYQSSIAVALHTIEATVALKQEQREALSGLLLALPAPQASGQYDHYLIMYRLAGLPPEKIQLLLDDRQWTALKQQFNQYRGMKEFLIQQGLLTREELAEPGVAPAQREAQP
jgi:hypothetical protein